MTVLALLQQLHAYGVVLTPYPNGTLRYKAPKGALTPARLDAMRQYKVELYDVIEAFEERAAIAEYCGGLSRPAAEALAWQCVLIPHDGRPACGYEDGNTEGGDYACPDAT